MCGRFSQGEPSHRISDYFGAHPDEDLPDGIWNVPPTESIRIVIERDGERRLVAARWGFQPFWADGTREAPARSWINARAETAWDSTAFGPALRATRCVIPADAFYEWDRSVTPRQPYAIGPSAEGEMYAMQYEMLIPLLIDATQTLERENQSLQAENESLAARLASLEAMVEQLMSKENRR